MRRLITHLEHALDRHRQHHERGAIAVIVALCMVVILGFVALAIDAGAMYEERAELQSAADAAALAVAQECASGGADCTQEGAEALALKYAKSNLRDNFVKVEAVTLTGETATVDVLTQDAEGNNELALTFAPVIGTDSVKIGATATAKWGFPHKGPAKLPVAFNKCVFSYQSEPEMMKLQRLAVTGIMVPAGVGEPEPEPDPEPECVNTSATLKPDGINFVISSDGCAVDSVEVGTFVDGKGGISFPVECESVLAESVGEVVLVPIFDEVDDQGTWNRYKISAWAAFELHGYDLGSGVSGGEPAPAGSGEGLYGKFVQIVTLSEADYIYGGPDYGASLVTLIK